MPEILKPLTFDDLPIKPALVGRPKVSEDLQQTVALLVGWDKSTRRLVSVSPTGVLHVASAPVKGIINITSGGAGDTWNGGDIETSEVMIKADPAGVNRGWINVGSSAAVNKGFPLLTGEIVVLSLNNLKSLHFYFTGTGDKFSIVYTK